MITSESMQIPRVGIFGHRSQSPRCDLRPASRSTARPDACHLVHLEYKDEQLPLEARLLWELEPRKELLKPTALPSASAADPIPPEDFDALLRATRWTAASPYLDPDAEEPVDRLPISSPFHGAVQTEHFQFVPLLKALRMPRVNLLIADDVGLAKP